MLPNFRRKILAMFWVSTFSVKNRAKCCPFCFENLLQSCWISMFCWKQSKMLPIFLWELLQLFLLCQPLFWKQKKFAMFLLKSRGTLPNFLWELFNGCFYCSLRLLTFLYTLPGISGKLGPVVLAPNTTKFYYVTNATQRRRATPHAHTCTSISDINLNLWFMSSFSFSVVEHTHLQHCGFPHQFSPILGVLVEQGLLERCWSFLSPQRQPVAAMKLPISPPSPKS